MESIRKQRSNVQETIINQFNYWYIIYKIYLHNINMYRYIFHSGDVISQPAINSGDHIFDCEHSEPPFEG